MAIWFEIVWWENKTHSEFLQEMTELFVRLKKILYNCYNIEHLRNRKVLLDYFRSLPDNSPGWRSKGRPLQGVWRLQKLLSGKYSRIRMANSTEVFKTFECASLDLNVYFYGMVKIHIKTELNENMRELD